MPSASDTKPFPTHVKSPPAELERVWAPKNSYHVRQAALKKAENSLNEDALFAQRSNSYLLMCLKSTLPTSEVWTQAFQ